MDGSANETRSGIGIVLESPNGLVTENTISFEFKASNNVAKCKTVIVGIDLARTANAKKLYIKSDSRLVVEQAT